MEYKKFASLILLILVAILINFCGQNRKEGEEPFNVIILTVDALRADHISAYGYSYQTTPHIDAFSKQSVLFEYAYCPLPKTSASLASFMTGLHPFVHKTKPTRDSLEKKYITLAEALKMKGYYNFAVVDNANLSKKFNFDQGFDRYTEVWNHIKGKEESSPFITRRVIEFLESNKNTPFLLWAHYIEPHRPYLPPPQFIEERPRGRIIRNIEHKIIAGHRQDIDDQSHEGHFISLYDGAVKHVDSELGKIINLVFKKGYNKNSIILLSSDHGEELGEHNSFFNHGSLTFQSSIRVPLILYVPNEQSRRIRHPVSLMDVYPTVLEQAGLSVPYKIQGVNLFRKPDQRFLLIEGQMGTRAVVYKNYHLVRISSRLSKRLDLENNYFFDIYDDPNEKKNISDRRKGLQDLMDKKYMEFFDKYGYLNTKQKRKPALSKKERENLKTLGYIK